MAGTADVTVVSLGTTPGLRRADDAFAEQLRAAGTACEVRRATIGRQRLPRRTLAVVDLGQALAARRAARGLDAGFVVYSTVTAALLQRRRPPYAVRFDAPAALNRPGPTGAWQRRAERRALAGARVLLPWSEAAARSAPADVPHVVVPVPIAAPAGDADRDLDAVAYAGDPDKRGLDAVCRAWAAAGGGGRLVVGGIDRERAVRWLQRRGVAEPAGVEWRGPVAHGEWLETVGRARLFVNASRWEDYGISQLEALSAGAALVTVPSPGPYEALPLARRLAPSLVDTDLTAALTAGLALGAAQLAAYRAHAAAALAPYRPKAVQELVEAEVVPLLDGR
jgi:glycosyltransferase involved in cell wall biosynthesis